MSCQSRLPSRAFSAAITFARAPGVAALTLPAVAPTNAAVAPAWRNLRRVRAETGSGWGMRPTVAQTRPRVEPALAATQSRKAPGLGARDLCPRYFFNRIFRMTGGVTGLLMPPSPPRCVGNSARMSTTSRPDVTRPKIV